MSCTSIQNQDNEKTIIPIVPSAVVNPQDEKMCAVCKKTIDADVRVTLLCSHSLHGVCAVKWIKKHDHCPECRSLIDNDLILEIQSDYKEKSMERGSLLQSINSSRRRRMKRPDNKAISAMCCCCCLLVTTVVVTVLLAKYY